MGFRFLEFLKLAALLVQSNQSQEFFQKCLHDAGVAIIPGTAFGKFAVHNVRLNFAISRENISKAIEKIDKILH